ncbi:MAG: tetratricopeptide repeat protein [Cyanobacteria bacterium P01_G01_bin.38]
MRQLVTTFPLSGPSLPNLGEGLGARATEASGTKPISPKRSQFIALAITLTLGLTLADPLLYPAPAEACFFWQACARRRGRATNTRAGGKRTGRIRGGNNPAIPYVISPRNTWIGDLPETIRWHPVAGANHYTVRLWQWSYARDSRELMIWETPDPVVGTAEIPFPTLDVSEDITTADTVEIALPVLALEPGIYYSIEVITDAGVSSNEDEGYLQSGFQLLFEEDYGELRSRLAEVNTGDATTAEEATLAEAGVYFLDEMYADALRILEPLTLDPAASDLVYTALGDIYSKIGLNLLALEAYGQALELARVNPTSSDDRLLSEAIILVNQADVYATQGNFDQAQQRLTQARIAYSLLGAEVEISVLDRRIEVLSTAQWQSP